MRGLGVLQPPPRRPRIRMTSGISWGRAALLAVALLAPSDAVRAEEPLYLRIRANPAARLDGAAGAGQGQGQRTAPTAGSAVADTARESVWERSDRRARIAIASVCDGCLATRSAVRAFMPSSVTDAPASGAAASGSSTSGALAADLSPPAPPTAGDP
ncbi:hypothetical protein [Methylobacterium sp. B4]|uniref:hypothetical protein n=1 Tax=Methylobacterium sp. B4 TaxID=1938755 RepID=UPI000D95DF0D|nr:hypothetical protein [Methylobacterium sp. B4]PXW63040.1 hypothetical protein BY998_106157 [Methylobacterium sp. B4]